MVYEEPLNLIFHHDVLKLGLGLLKLRKGWSSNLANSFVVFIQNVVNNLVFSVYFLIDFGSFFLN